MFNKKIILNNIKKLTKTELKVANYALKKGYDIINISILEIAKESKTSVATVNRTFSKLGFSGLKFYKMFLFSRTNQDSEWSNELSGMKDSLMLSLENTFASLKIDTINKVVNTLIKNREKILIIAEGFSLNIAEIFARKLMKLKFNAIVFNNHWYPSAWMPNVLVIISHSGSRSIFLQVIEKMKAANKRLKIIIITNNQLLNNNPSYDYVLCGSFVDNYRVDAQQIPSDSLILLILICNIIIDGICKVNDMELSRNVTENEI